VAGGGDQQRLYGGNDADSLQGGNGAGQNLLGQEGNDTLVAGGGEGQLLHGGNGADSLQGGNGVGQELYGEAGDDTLVAGGGNNQFLIGGSDNDSLLGGTNNDNLLGGDGNDTLSGAAGNDTLLGGNGTDLASYANAGGAVTVDLAAGTSSGADGNDNLSGFEGVFGSDYDDSVAGGSGNDVLLGHGGNDTLQGREGDDTIYGGNGNDLLSYTEATSAVSVNLAVGAGNDATPGAAEGGAGSDVIYGIQGVIGSDHNDSLLGNNGANTLLGGNGVDTLSGGASSDWLDFGAGDENFLRDVSETGNDTLIGGLGNDTLDLGSNWSFLSNSGGYLLYQDQNDTIYTQGWENVVCFAEGTRIVTPNGEDAVENLRAGDMVLAMRDGQAGFEPLRWVGFMDVAVPRNAAMAAKTAPILIKAGAIAAGMPARDLRVSPDHAMEVDGHLIPAKHLVNGSSIIQEVWCKRVRYFHLELEAHGLLLSEGTWSESYLDDGNRHAFNNAAMTGLFLDFEAGRSKGQYDHQACLPVLRHGLKLDEIHGRLALRAEELARGAKGRRRG
jgi:Ca2+-binding RTX toxin-like protein